MEFEIWNVDRSTNVYDLTRAFAEILHSPEFFDEEDPKARRMNLKIDMEKSDTGYLHQGKGKLTLPSPHAGKKFKDWLKVPDHRVRVDGKSIKIRPVYSGKPVPRWLKDTLQKTPFMDPDREQEREEKISRLNDSVRLNKVQFGVYYIVPEGGRAFSYEYTRDCITQDVAWLWMNYDHKVIRIELGDPVTARERLSIVVRFVSINKIGVGYDMGNPFICFELHTPPILEKEDFYRARTGDEAKDNRKFRNRLIAVDDEHARVAPYAHHLRLVLVEGSHIQKFVQLCTISGIPTPFKVQLEASQRGLFTARRLRHIQRWVAACEWATAFQIELIMHNGLVTSEELLEDLYEPIMNIYHQDTAVCADLLRNFAEGLHSAARPRGETALQCFFRVCEEKKGKTPLDTPSGMFSCHHITFTPTRLILEGPYAIQSNRVIRRYPRHQDHFIRVDFRDEDRLQYRWDREVDGTSFLHARVGRVLRDGFELGGRVFQFLAYSSSALREHSVWFVSPFQDPGNTNHGPEVEWITASEIRKTLGDFSGVANQPAKYAARMAQAFTATDPSVKISRDQWHEVPDLGEKPYLHTDGVGTISPQLADEIWAKMCEDNNSLSARKIKPSAYQIRFLGYKGMVGIDCTLEGKQMRLRPSMNKFRVHTEEDAEIEIARAFDRPMACNMSRSFIMILEDRGVHRDVFMDLQNDAKANTFLSDRDLARYRTMVTDQGLGTSYYIGYVAQQLLKLGLDLNETPQPGFESLEYGFFRRLVRFAIHHTLRDIKHGARIPINNGWLLPGIADEGPTYEAEDVFILEKGMIFACIQGPDDEQPKYIKGRCIIWRSPVVHPGDVQQVYAVGEPPADKLCAFRGLKNVVVLPSVGGRSLASQLGGGDVDGDIFYISQDPGLLPQQHQDAANYEGVDPFTLKDGRTATIEDVCDFVVNYIQSDVLGLLSDRHLVIADQSKEGTLDKACIELARLCGLAVDFSKSGVPVDIQGAPRALIQYKPDWKCAEVVNPDKLEYYESDRALGFLYRDFDLPTHEDLFGTKFGDSAAPFTDNVSQRVLAQVRRFLPRTDPTDAEPAWLVELFQRYLNELRYICATHTLSNVASTRLSEEEVVIGTILAECSQRRWRKDRIARMKTHSRVLRTNIEHGIFKDVKSAQHTRADLLAGLERAWAVWCFSVRYRGRAGADGDGEDTPGQFGANSFGLIGLALLFALVEQLEANVEPRTAQELAGAPPGDDGFAPANGRPGRHANGHANGHASRNKYEFPPDGEVNEVDGMLSPQERFKATRGGKKKRGGGGGGGPSWSGRGKR